jgi:hypothetical protein
MRILNQREAARQRKNVSFCYICGKNLHSSSGKSHNVVTKEHVIPRALLGEAPALNAWPVLLDVHEKCERSYKRKQDHWLALYAKFMKDPYRKMLELKQNWDALINSEEYSRDMKNDKAKASYFDWVLSLNSKSQKISQAWIKHLHSIDLNLNPSLAENRDKCVRIIREIYDPLSALQSGYYRSTPLKFGRFLSPIQDNRVGIISGLEELQKGVWLWNVGFHAILYNKVTRFISIPFCIPNIPVFSANPEKSFRKMKEHAYYIMRVLEIAEYSDKWDGISAWGDSVLYKCAWFSIPEMIDCARCYWKLTLPESKYESQYAAIFGEISWLGVYEQKEPPPNASIIGHEEFDAFNSEHFVE